MRKVFVKQKNMLIASLEDQPKKTCYSKKNVIDIAYFFVSF